MLTSVFILCKMKLNMAEIDIVLGAKFADFESLSRVLKNWEENYVSLYTSSCSIEPSSKQVPKMTFELCVKFGEIDFA